MIVALGRIGSACWAHSSCLLNGSFETSSSSSVDSDNMCALALLFKKATILETFVENTIQTTFCNIWKLSNFRHLAPCEDFRSSKFEGRDELPGVMRRNSMTSRASPFIYFCSRNVFWSALYPNASVDCWYAAMNTGNCS